MRVIWVCNNKNYVNLSIGYDTILSLNIKKAVSKLRGTTQALQCIAKFHKNRYEFVFTSLVKNSPRLFTTVQAVLKAYETSRIFRDLKMRGSIVKDGQLILLPGEHITSSHPGIWNLSSDHGNLGTMYLTNVRVVWKADLAPNFNASMPYTTISSIRVRNHDMFGRALVFDTFQRAGGYVLGFRVDPIEGLEQIRTELVRLHRAHNARPNFGVTFTVEGEMPSLAELSIPRIEEDVEIYDNEADTNAVAAYYSTELNADDINNHQGDIDGDGNVTLMSVDRKLGLAMQPPPRGTTVESIWRVI